MRNSTLLSVYLGVALGLVHYKWFGGRALHCTVLCRDSAEEDGAAGAAGARDFASEGGRRISFYFLVLTVVPVVRESSDQKAPVWPRPQATSGFRAEFLGQVSYDEQRSTGLAEAC